MVSASAVPKWIIAVACLCCVLSVPEVAGEVPIINREQCPHFYVKSMTFLNSKQIQFGDFECAGPVTIQECHRRLEDLKFSARFSDDVPVNLIPVQVSQAQDDRHCTSRSKAMKEVVKHVLKNLTNGGGDGDIYSKEEILKQYLSVFMVELPEGREAKQVQQVEFKSHKFKKIPGENTWEKDVHSVGCTITIDKTYRKLLSAIQHPGADKVLCVTVPEPVSLDFDDLCPYTANITAVDTKSLKVANLRWRDVKNTRTVDGLSLKGSFKNSTPPVSFLDTTRCQSELRFDEHQTMVFPKANHDLAGLSRLSLHNETDDEVCTVAIRTKTKSHLKSLLEPNDVHCADQDEDNVCELLLTDNGKYKYSDPERPRAAGVTATLVCDKNTVPAKPVQELTCGDNRLWVPPQDNQECIAIKTLRSCDAINCYRGECIMVEENPDAEHTKKRPVCECESEYWSGDLCAEPKCKPPKKQEFYKISQTCLHKTHAITEKSCDVHCVNAAGEEVKGKTARLHCDPDAHKHFTLSGCKEETSDEEEGDTGGSSDTSKGDGEGEGEAKKETTPKKEETAEKPKPNPNPNPKPDAGGGTEENPKPETKAKTAGEGNGKSDTPSTSESSDSKAGSNESTSGSGSKASEKRDTGQDSKSGDSSKTETEAPRQVADGKCKLEQVLSRYMRVEVVNASAFFSCVDPTQYTLVYPNGDNDAPPPICDENGDWHTSGGGGGIPTCEPKKKCELFGGYHLPNVRFKLKCGEQESSHVCHDGAFNPPLPKDECMKEGMRATGARSGNSPPRPSAIGAVVRALLLGLAATWIHRA